DNDDLAILLLKKGAAVDSADPEGITPLMLATKDCHEELVKQLLKSKAHLNQQDRYGWTALMWAAKHDKKQCAHLLLKAGADMTIRSKDKKAIIDMLTTDNK